MNLTVILCVTLLITTYLTVRHDKRPETKREIDKTLRDNSLPFIFVGTLNIVFPSNAWALAVVLVTAIGFVKLLEKSTHHQQQIHH